MGMNISTSGKLQIRYPGPALPVQEQDPAVVAHVVMHDGPEHNKQHKVQDSSGGGVRSETGLDGGTCTYIPTSQMMSSVTGDSRSSFKTWKLWSNVSDS